MIMTDEFRKKMNDEFIPAVQRMVEKEGDHIEALRKARRRMLDRNTTADLSMIDGFIRESEKMLEHFSLRLKQYRDFVK